MRAASKGHDVVIEIRPLASDERERVDAALRPSRLEQPGGEYLIAWEDEEPVGHVHIDWRVDPPELQDVFVAEQHRRHRIGTALAMAAEDLARQRGFAKVALTVSADNPPARALYEMLGYRPTGVERRVQDTIVIRGQPVEVDCTLVAYEKTLTNVPLNPTRKSTTEFSGTA
jgi:GNAT superfamily N-acetyltransferase